MEIMTVATGPMKRTVPDSFPRPVTLPAQVTTSHVRTDPASCLNLFVTSDKTVRMVQMKPTAQRKVPCTHIPRPARSRSSLVPAMTTVCQPHSAAMDEQIVQTLQMKPAAL